ncbi:PD-(D/E)XK motif protein [Priestia aryabhattai]|uniref:PD-(D/E)XK motif protein n=1 Tax=Priestia aryabhattai TaxID=412384 RepID=UPI000399E543
MINLKHEFQQMIKEIENQESGDIYKLKLISTTQPYLLAGIDTLNMNRQLYIDLGQAAWEDEQMKSLPRWRGLSLDIKFFERMGPLKKRYFLVLKQESEKSPEIFEDLLQNLIEHLEFMTEGDTLFSVVFSVLDRWRNFFSRGGYYLLTEEQQRGLFGELYFIREWMNKFPAHPPLLIEQWEGPMSGRIDFKNTKYAVEIKTCVEKLRKEIKIANEKQLKLTEVVNKIYLYVCFIEPNQTHGQSLQEIVEEIRGILSHRSERLLLKFNDLLMELGFKEDEYKDKLFFVHTEEAYEVTEDFPKISDEILPAGVSHVSYSIDLNHCKAFERKIDEVFKM